MQTLSRRQTLAGAALAAAALVSPRAARAQDANQPASAAGIGPSPYYASTLGKLQMLVISDGTLGFAPAHPVIGPDLPKPLVDAALSENNLNPASISIECNVLLVRDGNRLILVDTGSGKNMGARAGKLHDRLEAAGIDRRSITDVIITHAHPDHIGGCLLPDGSAAFPNARGFLSKAEVAFWRGGAPDLSRVKVDEASKAGFVQAALAGLNAFGKRLETLPDDGAITDSIRLTPLPGHTPGQCGVELTSEGESVLVAADCISHHVVGVVDAALGLIFDTDPTQAILTRRLLLQRLAESRTRLFSFHINWPGLGRIVRAEGKYSWQLEPWKWSEFAR